MAADRIRVSLGITKNLGDFNSLRLDASIETDAKDGETTDDAFARAWETVDAQVSAQIDAKEE